MNTSYVLIASYQYWENYDVDGETEHGYWKAKGGHEEVICSFRLTDIQAMAENGSVQEQLEAIVAQSELGFFHYTSMTRYDLCDYELVEVSDSVVNDVYDMLVEYKDKGEGDLSWIQYQYSEQHSEYQFEVACHELHSQGRLDIDIDRPIWSQRSFGLN